MKEKIRQPQHSGSRSIADSVGRGNQVRQLKAPRSFFSAAPVIQLEKEAKNEIVLEKEEQSEEVPELDKETAKILNKAKQKPKLRQNAVEALFKYLQEKKAVEILEEQPNPPIEMKIVYVNEVNDNNLALTQYKSYEKKATITLTVYRDLFEKPLPVIYSAFRHELIHAAQRMKGADKITDKADDYIYSLEQTKEEIGGENLIGRKGEYKKISKYVIHPLQEIEAHCWEIKNSEKTGIDKTKKYLKETYYYTIQYAKFLISWLNSRYVKKDLVKNYEGYIQKGIDAISGLGEKIGELKGVLADIKLGLENKMNPSKVKTKVKAKKMSNNKRKNNDRENDSSKKVKVNDIEEIEPDTE